MNAVTEARDLVRWLVERGLITPEQAAGAYACRMRGEHDDE